MDEYLIVSGEQDFSEFVVEIGLCPAGTRVRSSVHPDDLREKHVVCHTLPLHLAAAAYRVTTVKVEAPPWMRRRTMKLEHWREYASRTETYRVEEIASRDLKKGVA